MSFAANCTTWNIESIFRYNYEKIFCGVVIALIGVIYSIALMVLATVNDVYGNGVSGLWGLLQGYDAELPLIISLCVVMIGIAVCVWGVFEKKK